MTGRFLRPWRVVGRPASFAVEDTTGQNVAWFHFRNDPGIAQSVAVRLKGGGTAESHELRLAVGTSGWGRERSHNGLTRPRNFLSPLVFRLGPGHDHDNGVDRHRHFALNARAFWLMAPEQVSPNTVADRARDFVSRNLAPRIDRTELAGEGPTRRLECRWIAMLGAAKSLAPAGVIWAWFLVGTKRGSRPCKMID